MPVGSLVSNGKCKHRTACQIATKVISYLVSEHRFMLKLFVSSKIILPEGHSEPSCFHSVVRLHNLSSDRVALGVVCCSADFITQLIINQYSIISIYYLQT